MPQHGKWSRTNEKLQTNNFIYCRCTDKDIFPQPNIIFIADQRHREKEREREAGGELYARMHLIWGNALDGGKHTHTDTQTLTHIIYGSLLHVS